MKRRVKIYNIIAVLMLILQVISYLGSLTMERKVITDTAERIGSYIGYNFFLIIVIIFLISAGRLKKKIKQQEVNEAVDSIGRE